MKNVKTNNFTTKKFFALALGFLLLIATVFGILFGTYRNARAEVTENTTANYDNSISGKKGTVKQRARGTVNASSHNLDFILKNLKTDAVKINTDSFEIYGNGTVTEKEFRDIVYNGSPKIYLHYRTNRNIDMSYDALLMVKTYYDTYSYEFVEHEATDANSILNGISSFVSKYSDVLQGGDYYALEHNAPMTLAADVPTTFIDNVVEKEYVARFDKYGYVVYHIAVSRYTVDSKSILFIVTIKNSFVPGAVANYNDEPGYDKYLNSDGYVHMTVAQAFDRNEEYYYGKREGNIPYRKDFWPVNNPATVTITSSVQNGKTLGRSTKLGFSKDGLSLGGETSTQYNISYEYIKSITQDEPAVSAQVSSSKEDKCEWNYSYAVKTAKTNDLVTNYMFEIENSRAELFIGDFRLMLDYKFGVYKNKKEGVVTRTVSDDLMVRAGEYKNIYRFCNGMI